MPAYKVEVFDLATDRSVQDEPRDCGFRFVAVAQLPDGFSGVEVALDDDGTFIPINGLIGGLKACSDEGWRRIRVRNNPTSGLLKLLCTNEPVPLIGAGPTGGGATLRRLFECYHHPLTPAQAGGAFDGTGHGPGGAPFAGFLATEVGGAGLVPVTSVRGHRCIHLRPNAGTSGVLCAVSFPWQRLLAEPTGFGATLGTRRFPRLASYRVDVALRREAAAPGKTVGTGLQLNPGNGTLENISGGNAGIGIVGDGADWWQLVARAVNAGPFTVVEAVPRVTPDCTRWLSVGLELVDADPANGRDGKVIAHVAGVPFASFTDMSLFPPAFDGVVATGLDVRVIDEGAAADSLQYSDFHVAIDSVAGGGP